MAMFEQAINMVSPFNAQESDSAEDPQWAMRTNTIR